MSPPLGDDVGLALEEGVALALGLGQAGDVGAETLALGFEGAGVGLSPVPPALMRPVGTSAGLFQLPAGESRRAASFDTDRTRVTRAGHA